MLFGAHVSVSCGYDKALDYAQSVGCECIQIFAKSPRQWRSSALNQPAVDAFRLLREDPGGAGSTFGSTLAEIGACIEAAGLGPDRLGTCFDTCHGWAFGYRVDTAHGWRSTVDDLERAVGVERLGLIHANDCKFEAGTHRDRHEWIGDGFIGNEGFSAMVAMPELSDVPVVTEMPGEIPEKDLVNVQRLAAMRDACARSQ
jgi:deoxyribonuclease-4